MNTGNHIDRWKHPAAVFLLTFAVYCWSAPRTVVLEDDGLFILAAYFNGIAHPPGYPLYTLLAHISTWIPFGTVAYRVHVLSGLFAALSCVFLWKLASELTRDRIAAYASSLGFGYSLTFWSQSIIAEVYTLNVLLVLVISIYCLSLANSNNIKSARRKIYILFLLYGLALSNHWPLLILATPMFIAFLWPQITLVARHVTGSIFFLLTGLLPYLWMVVRSNMDPVISFYGPVESWNDFWFYVSRQGYESIDVSASAGWTDKIYFFANTFTDLATQFGPVCILFILVGFVYQFSILKNNIILALFLGYLGSTLVLIGLLDFDYDHLHKAVFRVYPLVAWCCASIWLGIGVIALSRYLQRITGTVISKRFISIALTLLVSGSSFAANLSENYRANDYWADQYATAILDSLPADAAIFLSGEENAGPVGYKNLVEKYRSDVRLYHFKGRVFDNRLYRPFKVTYKQAESILGEFIRSADSPVYFTGEFIHTHGIEFYGLFSRVLANHPGDYYRVVLTPRIKDYWETIINNPEPYHQWNMMHYQSVMASGCRLLYLIDENTPDGDRVTDELEVMRHRLCNNLQGAYIELEMAIRDEQQEDRDRIAKLVAKAGSMLEQSRGKAETAQLDYYRGRLYQKNGDMQKAMQAYRQSLSIWDHPDNPAYSSLGKIIQ